MKSTFQSVIQSLFVAMTVLAFSHQVTADDKIKLPNVITWSTYTIGSSGYNNTVSIGKVFKDKLGVNLRPIPGKNDVARLAPMRSGKVDFGLAGGGAFFAFEGTSIFGKKGWGPQALRVLVYNRPDSGMGIITLGDSGIKTIADIRDKRVGTVLSSATIESIVTGGLAFGGMTWDDVKRVEFPGYVASLNGLINGQADVVFALTTSAKLYEMESSSHGLRYIPFEHSNKEGWSKMRQYAPHIVPHIASEGPGLSKDNKIEVGTYPYPILASYKDADDETVYNLTKAMYVYFDEYKDMAPGNAGFALERQIYNWGVPFHPGTIRYLKEAGAWKPEYDAHQTYLLKREKVLAGAWASYNKSAPSDDKAFQEGWEQARKEALAAAGMS